MYYLDFDSSNPVVRKISLLFIRAKLWDNFFSSYFLTSTRSIKLNFVKRQNNIEFKYGYKYFVYWNNDSTSLDPKNMN